MKTGKKGNSKLVRRRRSIILSFPAMLSRLCRTCIYYYVFSFRRSSILQSFRFEIVQATCHSFFSLSFPKALGQIPLTRDTFDVQSVTTFDMNFPLELDIEIPRKDFLSGALDVVRYVKPDWERSKIQHQVSFFFPCTESFCRVLHCLPNVKM